MVRGAGRRWTPATPRSSKSPCRTPATTTWWTAPGAQRDLPQARSREARSTRFCAGSALHRPADLGQPAAAEAAAGQGSRGDPLRRFGRCQPRFELSSEALVFVSDTVSMLPRQSMDLQRLFAAVQEAQKDDGLPEKARGSASTPSQRLNHPRRN